MFKKHRYQDLDMTFWWRKHPKEPADYVQFIVDQLSKGSSVDHVETKKKMQDELSKYLVCLKCFLLNEIEPKLTTETIENIYNELFSTNFFYCLFQNLSVLDFESRKEVFLIYSVCLRHTREGVYVTVEHLKLHPECIALILSSTSLVLQGRYPKDIFFVLGRIIVETVNYESLCSLMMKDPFIWEFFTYSNLPNFEISTESLQVLSAILTSHPKLVSKTLLIDESKIEMLINKINGLIYNGNYVVKRQSTKLLGNLLTVRSNHQLMTSYINDPDNLKLIMLLLADKSKNIQHEAFNVFKVIAANPKKTQNITDILLKNKVKLLVFFEGFGSECQDQTFIDERDFIKAQIEKL